MYRVQTIYILLDKERLMYIEGFMYTKFQLSSISLYINVFMYRVTTICLPLYIEGFMYAGSSINFTFLPARVKARQPK